MSQEPDGRVLVTLYVARSLDLPPLTAQAALAAHREGTQVVRANVAELHFTRGGTTGFRSAPAILRRRGGVARFPVEVEVSPWSARRSEIGIRPVRKAVPMADGWRRRHYLALATEAADGLAQVLVARVHDWVTEQLPAGEVKRCAA